MTRPQAPEVLNLKFQMFLFSLLSAISIYWFISLTDGNTKQIPFIYNNQLETASAITLFYNATVYTSTPDSTAPASSFAVQNGRFVSVGHFNDLSKIYPQAKSVNLRGYTVTSGLIDSHVHLLSLGNALKSAKLEGSKSVEIVLVRLIEYLANNPIAEGGWLVGRGWNQNIWESQEFPTKNDLKHPILNKIPIYLERIDGHACWVNQKVLDIIGEIPSTDPEGGSIVRDKDGLPTGVFIDNAQDLVFEHIPEPSDNELHTRLQLAINEVLKYGLTGVHDAGVSPKEIEVYKQAVDLDTFPIRNYVMLGCGTDYCGDFEKIPDYGNKGKLFVKSVKLFSDGALGSYGAAMDAPYTDNNSTSGFLLDEESVYHDLVQKYIANGWQVNSHAIGDRANRVMLDCYQDALGNYTGSDMRHRMEHAQIISEKDIARYGKIGIIPSVQPAQATSDMYWLPEKIGPERVKGSYAWRKLLNAKVPALPLGSDFPVEAVNPLEGFYSAITRMDHDGNSPEGQGVGWTISQTLSREEALRGFTLDAAYASHLENEIGSISVGKRADFVVLDKNIMEIEPKLILKTQVVATYIDGEAKYQQ